MTGPRIKPSAPGSAVIITAFRKSDAPCVLNISCTIWKIDRSRSDHAKSPVSSRKNSEITPERV